MSVDISKCEACHEDCPQAQGRHEAALGRMYAMHELVKCAPYWDALFDENELPKITPDRLRELVEADRDGRCWVLPFAPGTTIYEADGEHGVVKHSLEDSVHFVIHSNALADDGSAWYDYWTDEDVDNAHKPERMPRPHWRG